MARTVSGHPVLAPGSDALETRSIPGTDRPITAARWALPVLLDFLRRWNAHPLLGGGRFPLAARNAKGRFVGPVDSYAHRPARAADAASDHNGYAVDIRYDILKADHQRHMTKAETSAVRYLLKAYDGALAWGGDYENLIDEMHVYVAPDQTPQTFARLRLRLGIHPNGTRTAKPAPKPRKGRTKLTEPTLRRKAPGEHAPHKGMRKRGFSFRYVDVVGKGSDQYLVTRFGTYYKAENTTRGVG